MKFELVFIPSPGAGHLPPTLGIAKLLLEKDDRLSIAIIIMNLPSKSEHNPPPPVSADPRLRFIHINCQESTRDLISPYAFLYPFMESHKPQVREIVLGITQSDSVRLAGFVVDMFCVDMIDVAKELGAPSYVYFTSCASMLGLMFSLQKWRDEEGYDVTELRDSESELAVPSYVNPVPAKVLPSVVFDKEGASAKYLDLAKRFRELNGIMVNTFQELEWHCLESLSSSYAEVPPVFPVGPILNLKNTGNEGKRGEIMRWLDDQPESTVVFLCFGSNGSFGEEQLKEIAVALERSGQRFLWSLRRPPPKGTMEPPTEYENPEEVLPEGFHERTSSMGKVIGWAPQVAVLSHPSVGGFVSHCGWNSTLESIWCGIPMAAWPVYAEQQMNAFQLVAELGLAAEIRMDYQTSVTAGGKEMLVTAEEIESGIQRLMSDGEMRKRVKEMKEKSRMAVADGGSSLESIGRFIEHLMNNIP